MKGRLSVPDDWEALTAAALAGLAGFHVLGNAAALALGLPRRPVQGAFLATFLGLATYGYSRAYDVRQAVQSFRLRRLGAVLAGLVGLVAIKAWTAGARGLSLDPYAISVGIIVPAWLLVVGLLVLTGLGRARNREMGPPVASGMLGPVLVGLLGGLVTVAYLFGPEPGDIMMTFGGSVIQASTAAAALGGVALVAVHGWPKPVALALAVYLVFVATSRTGILVSGALLGASVLSIALDSRATGARVRESLGQVVLVAGCVVAVVLLARSSLFFPYASSRPAVVRDVRVPDGTKTAAEWDAFMVRFGRLGRVVPGVIPEGEGGVTGAFRKADSRWPLVLDSVGAVAANPWGYWPERFDAVTSIWCGRPLICPYPHNLLLEVAFHFGWLPGSLLAIGLAFAAWRAVLTLARGRLSTRVAAVGFLAYLGTAQFSGDLVDSVYALGFAVAWHATQSVPLAAGPARHRSATAGCPR